LIYPTGSKKGKRSGGEKREEKRGEAEVIIFSNHAGKERRSTFSRALTFRLFKNARNNVKKKKREERKKKKKGKG